MGRNHGIGPRSTRVDKDPDRGYEIRYNRHPRRKNNFKIAEMYDCYRDGMSLATIAKLYKCTRQAVWDVFRTRGYPMRSKDKAGRYHTTCYGVKWYRTKDGYLRGTLEGRRTTLHKVVWERARGPVPRTHVLRFVDGDKTRCTLSNLELVEKTSMPKKFARKV